MATKKKRKPKSSPARLRAQAKYNRKPEQRKRRAELNKENRRRGTYGNGDGKDVSHCKNGKTCLEKASTNRRRNGRNGKSKLK